MATAGKIAPRAGLGRAPWQDPALVEREREVGALGELLAATRERH